MNGENFFKPGEEVRPEPYHYKACGLEGIYLLNGYTVEEHDGERHVFVENVDELHKAIGRHIISKRKGLTGAEIRFLRNTLDVLRTNQLVSQWATNHDWRAQTQIVSDPPCDGDCFRR